MGQLGKFTTMKANEIPSETGLDMLLYSDQGVGKTWLLGTAQDSPHGADLLIVDVDGGARTVCHSPEIEVIVPANFRQVEQICDAFIQEEHSFKTVAIDSLSEAQRMLVEEIGRTTKNPEAGLSQAEWGRIGDRIHSLIRKMRHISKSKGYNVIFTTVETLAKDERTGRKKRLPYLTPSVRSRVCLSIDTVGMLEVDYKSGTNDKNAEQEYNRVLTLENRPDTITKTRQPKPGEEFMFTPLPGRIVNPSMVDILEIINTPPTRPTVEDQEIYEVNDA